MPTRQFVGALLLSTVAVFCHAAVGKTLRFSADNFYPFSGPTPSPVATFSGAVKYDEPTQFNTYGSIDFFRVKLDGSVFTPTNATVYLTTEPFFGLPLLDFEGDVANFDHNGNTLHFLLVNEYSYGAALNLGLNGGALQWQSLDVTTKPRNPAPWPIQGVAAPVPEPASAALVLVGAAGLLAAIARRRLR